MKKIYLIWIIGLFLLALPFVNAIGASVIMPSANMSATGNMGTADFMQTSTPGGATGHVYCFNQNETLQYVSKSPSSTATTVNVSLMDGTNDGAWVATSTFTANNASFNLALDSKCYIIAVFTNPDSAHTSHNSDGANEYSYALRKNAMFNVTQGFCCGNKAILVEYSWDIVSLTVANTSGGTPPPAASSLTLKGSLNDSSLFWHEVVNASFNTSSNYNISRQQISINDTGITRFFNFTPSLNETIFSQNFTISCAPCIVNITGWANDTTGTRITYTNLTTVSANLILNASEIYNGVGLNFTAVLVSGGIAIANQSTTNGIITIANISNSRYNITILATNYFQSKYDNVDVLGQMFIANISQAWLSLNATDLLTAELMLSFSLQHNLTLYSTTNGYMLIPFKAGTFTLNITTSTYPLKQYTISLSALQNLTFTANLSPQFQFYLKREADNSNFDVLGTNTTILTIYCPTKNIIITFKNLTFNSTQQNTTIDCPFTLMKMDITYSDSSYFRTLIPEYNQQNVTWWLLDLNVDIGVQKIIELVDLTGDWSNGLIRITRAIGQNNEDMIEQFFDVSTAVTLYLLKDALYTVVLVNNDGTEERQLGTMIADTAGTVTITYPNLPFYPEQTYLEDNLSWSYSCPFQQCAPPFNTSSQILRLQYQDSTMQTTSATWTVYNGSSQGSILQTFTSTSSNFSFTFQPTRANDTYYTTFFLQHALLDYNVTETRFFGGGIEVPGELPGWSGTEEANLKKWISGTFLLIWSMLFSAYHAGIGMVTTFGFAVIFKSKGWFPINYVWLSLIGFVAIVGFIWEAKRRDGQ